MDSIHNLESKVIRVMLVDDSPLAITALKRILSSSPEIDVVGTASSGSDALELIPQLNPDIICTDIHMPEMDGYELTRYVMERFPKPILAISTSVHDGENADNIFNILKAGAIDVFPKPRCGLDLASQEEKKRLINKIKVISGVVVFRKFNRISSSDSLRENVEMSLRERKELKVIAIGASTGGPVALLTILKELPRDFALPIISILHISEGFLDGCIDWLNSQCKINVKVAQHNEFPLPGFVYFAPEGSHLEMDDKGRFVYSDDPFYDNLYRPSITVTFESIAKYYGKHAVGILLTGMGSDGVQGMKAVSEKSRLTIAQDEESSVIYGMPKLSFELGYAKFSLSLEDIIKFILSIVNM
jgi:two-component system, chemotaxis family, protein-glutamate methylesterase/glutaminase